MLLDIPIHMHTYVRTLTHICTHAEWLSVELENKAEKKKKKKLKKFSIKFGDVCFT